MPESFNNLMSPFTLFRERALCVVAAIVLVLSVRGVVQLLNFSVRAPEAVVEMPQIPADTMKGILPGELPTVAELSAYNPFQASFAIAPPVVVVRKTPPPPPKKQPEPKKAPPKRNVSLAFQGIRSSPPCACYRLWSLSEGRSRETRI